MLRLEDNPPILFPINEDIADICGQWWVARTKSRNEKAFAQTLLQWKIAYFLPLTEKVTKRRGRAFKSLLPLFGGYVFFCGLSQTKTQALTTQRIAQVIDVVDQKGLVRDLTKIHRALTSGAKLDPHPNLQEGTRCRVLAGPLEGTEGILLRKKNQTRLLLRVDILGQSAALDLDSDLLEPLE
mgnify:CR=1 FL=1